MLEVNDKLALIKLALYSNDNAISVVRQIHISFIDV